MKKIKYYFAASLFVLMPFLSIIKAHASINYNNIISDQIFDNSNSMSASQIDSFLNSFPSDCISTNNGFSAPAPISYSPSTSFVYSGDVSAGTVIYDAAQAYGINPQIIITQLQKEQSLITGSGGNIVRNSSFPNDCGALALSASMSYTCTDNQILTSYSGTEIYATNGPGTASQTGNTVTGYNTSWTSSMVGNYLVFSNGIREQITSVNSTTSLTVNAPSPNPSIAQTSYRMQVMSVNQTCVQNQAYVGFSEQVINSAWMLTFDRHRSEGMNNWYIDTTNWNNSDDLNFCYSGYDVAGGPYYLCPDQVGHTNDPYIQHSGEYSIDSTVVTMLNGATAALYDFTPHLAGQDSFNSIFTGWFGDTQQPLAGNIPSSDSLYAQSSCNIPSYSSSYVGRLYQPDTQDYLYTTDQSEACAAVKEGYIWDGVVMQSVSSTASNAEPVYRLANLVGHHFYTTSSVEENNLITQYGYHLENSAAWYVYSTQVSGSIPVTRLTNWEGTYFLTSSGSEATYYENNYGFTSQGVVFYTPSMGNSAGTTSIYRLNKNNQRLYTDSQAEITIAESQYGYSNEGVVSTDDNGPNANNAPVYRLISSSTGEYLYTMSREERDLAVINYNYIDQGIGFYALVYSSNPVYRDTNYSQNLRLYTNSLLESNLAVQKYGYNEDGVGWYGY